MYRFNKIMVHLNLDEYDDNLIRHARFISDMARSGEIVFIHVTDTFNIPDEIKKIYPELECPVDTAVENRMKEIAARHFNGHTSLTFKAMEGPSLGLLISASKEYDIDLLIVGHDPDETGTAGNLPEKLARKAFCSVLMIPANTRASLNKILVALDFSDHSLNAADVGSAFAKAAGLKEIYLLNTYRVPKGYHKTGKSYDEFAHIMLENAKSRLRAFLARADLKSLGIKPVFKKTDNIVQGIGSVADRMGADLVVVGARGRSGDIAAILLGSITEGLIRNLKQPLLAVKEKGEGLNILEAFSTE